MKHLFSAIACGLFVLLLCGCQTLSDHGAALPSMPAATTNIWQLSQGKIDDHLLNANLSAVSLNMGRDEFNGHTGVNQYRVKVQHKGAELLVDENIHITRMTGSVEQMRLESDFLSALRRVKQYSEQNGVLKLSGEGVELLFRHQP